MGEDGDADEPEKKKTKIHLDLPSCSPMANNSAQSPSNRAVDAAALQSQNQKLVQLLEAKKNEVHKLEGKFEELKEKQIAYDETLITVNKLWNQLVDDLILLELRLSGDPVILQALGSADYSRDLIPSCPPEETFLHRLLGYDPVDKIEPDDIVAYVQEALASRHLSTMDWMKHFQETIDSQRAKTESLAMILSGKPSSEDALIQLHKIDDSLREEVNNLLKAVDFLNMKHNQYADDIQSYLDSHLRDQSETKRISGELEESMAELEESRRKLVNLQMQKDGMPRMHGPALNAANGSSSPDKPPERTMGLREVKISVEEAKKLAASRFSELQDAQEENMILSKQLEDIEDELKDEKYVMSSQPYSVLNDQLQHLNMEHKRYKELVESLQADRNHTLRKEKELAAKAESANVARAASSTADAQIEDLEIQLEKCTIERADLEIKLQERLEDAGRKDIKDEIHVMASALSKEMEMMEAQLNRCKEAACEAISLRDEANSLEVQLSEKTCEFRSLSERCVEQAVELESLKKLAEELEREKKELNIILDMHGQECFDNRTFLDIKDSEHKAHMQAEVLKIALDEHSLELRVRAANEAESACQQRLSAAEAEIADLRTKLDASERDVLELTEAIRVKDAEADAYISEIEAIGQAYEDMQVQNQHLVQQVSERDDCNTKLVSDSVRMKQAHGYLLAEKQVIAKKLQQLNASVEDYRTKIICGEEQMKTLISQALKASSDNRHLAISLDKAKLELVMAEKELKWLSSAVDSYEKEFKLNQQNIASMQAELEIERNERKRLEDELTELKAEVDEMSAEKREAAIQKLQDEIKDCKAILKCGVCFDRPKEVVITKCFHLFCSQCIQRNLEIRHRRCPGCGAAFGQNDVREVNI